MSGLFTDEADAVSAVEIVPVSLVDEAGTVLAVFVAVSPIIRLARLPLPESDNTIRTRRLSIIRGVFYMTVFCL